MASEWLRQITKIGGRHAVSIPVEPQSLLRRKRGRQKVGIEPERITQYIVQWHWTGPAEARIPEERERQATVVLISKAHCVIYYNACILSQLLKPQEL